MVNPYLLKLKEKQHEGSHLIWKYIDNRVHAKVTNVYWQNVVKLMLNYQQVSHSLSRSFIHFDHCLKSIQYVGFFKREVHVVKKWFHVITIIKL